MAAHKGSFLPPSPQVRTSPPGFVGGQCLSTGSSRRTTAARIPKKARQTAAQEEFPLLGCEGMSARCPCTGFHEPHVKLRSATSVRVRTPDTADCTETDPAGRGDPARLPSPPLPVSVVQAA